MLCYVKLKYVIKLIIRCLRISLFHVNLKKGLDSTVDYIQIHKSVSQTGWKMSATGHSTKGYPSLNIGIAAAITMKMMSR